jgi:hypothetical protein
LRIRVGQHDAGQYEPTRCGGRFQTIARTRSKSRLRVVDLGAEETRIRINWHLSDENEAVTQVLHDGVAFGEHVEVGVE